MEKIHYLLICFLFFSYNLVAEASNFWEAGNLSFEIAGNSLYMQAAADNSGCSFDEQPYNCWTNEGELLFFRMHFYYNPPIPERPICTWATDLPSGALYLTVSDYGEVYNDFSWTPTCGQAGIYTLYLHAGEVCGTPLSTLPVDFNAYSVDSDVDGIVDCEDSCPNHHNPDQGDNYPPQGNTIGDACDCEADFTCDGDIDANDVIAFLADFGREQFYLPCTNGSPCNGDFDCDVDVDADDVTIFLADFGREAYYNPCPACVAGDWCVYE